MSAPSWPDRVGCSRSIPDPAAAALSGARKVCKRLWLMQTRIMRMLYQSIGSWQIHAGADDSVVRALRTSTSFPRAHAATLLCKHSRVDQNCSCDRRIWLVPLHMPCGMVADCAGGKGWRVEGLARLTLPKQFSIRSQPPGMRGGVLLSLTSLRVSIVLGHNIHLPSRYETSIESSQRGRV